MCRYTAVGPQGPEVEQIQARLMALGYYHGPIAGDFGGGTAAAVKALQRAQGLMPDGIIGETSFFR